MTITGASILADPPAGVHIVYPYNDERRAMELVATYAAAGIRNSEGVVLILTREHLSEIEHFLCSDGFDVGALRESGQLQCADAASTLAGFMVDGVPIRERFMTEIGPVVERAKRFGKVRAYGEMVSLLFDANHAAALQLEELWNDLLRVESICLLCTYDISSKSGLADDLCTAHSHYIV
jgi:hypothetical protein